MNSVVGLHAKAERRAEIIQLRRGGMRPRDIAQKFGLQRNTVNRILSDAGVTSGHVPNYADMVDRIWSLPDDERRIAIAKRAAQGARDTRRQLIGQPRE